MDYFFLEIKHKRYRLLLMLFSYLAELYGKTMLLKTLHTYLSCRTWKNQASTDLEGAIHATEREK